MAMDIPTYVTEASALIEGVHEIKRWVYEDSVRLLIPLCTYDQVQKAHTASVTPKDVPKDTTTTRSSGRVARKEQPSFDINPRAAWEFLSRVKSEKGLKGVKLQQENEEFTQWKEEDEKAAEKVEIIPTAPTSFADALLRKLNMKDDSESKGSKAPAKPRLVARANEPKSPWKYHKIPTVPSKGVSPLLKPLFSTALWHLYDCEKNPLMPENFVLLVGSEGTRVAAEKLGIPATMVSTVRSSLLETKLKNDSRLERGELEATFPDVIPLSDTTNHVQQANDQPPFTNGDIKLDGTQEKLNGIKEQQKVPVSEENVPLDIPTNGADAQKELGNLQDMDMENKATEDMGTPTPLRTATVAEKQPYESVSTKATESTPSEKANTTLPAAAMATNVGEKSPKKPPQLSRPSTATTVGDTKSEESELDSDEEIIVFDPRARRASGRKQREAPRSRPTTSNGLAPKILKSSPKESFSRPAISNRRSSHEEKMDSKGPVLANGTAALPEDEKVLDLAAKLKPKIESTLKPESPVFTPGKPYIPMPPQPTEESKPEASPSSANASPPKSPALPTHARNGPPRQPRAALQRRQASQDQLRLQRESQQRESEKMIQRQREAIQRRAKLIDKPPEKVVEKAVEKETEKPAEKPPPRQIQMEPTDNPTVIDPDAFDRSYVVQPPTNSPNTNSSAEKRRSKGHQSRGSATKRSQGSPKRKSKTPEPEVDYVLKSGAPRNSIRGKGKLWVP